MKNTEEALGRKPVENKPGVELRPMAAERQRLYASIDRRIECIIALRETIDEMMTEATHRGVEQEEVERRLKEIWEKVYQQMPEHSRREFESGDRMRAIRKDIPGKIDFSISAEKTLEKAIGDPELLFANEMMICLKMLREKNRMINARRNDREYWTLAAKKRAGEFGEGLTLDSINLFDVVCVVNNEKFRAGMSGMQLARSPIILIWEGLNQETRDGIVRHERTHNMLDMTNYFSIHASELKFAKLGDAYVRGEKNDERDQAKKELGKIFELGADNVIDMLHNELIASYREKERANDYYGKNTPIDLLSSSHFPISGEVMGSAFGTAGAELGHIRGTLRLLMQSNGDNEFKEKCERFFNEMEEKNEKMIKILHESCALSLRIGADASLVLEGLLVMLRPSQWRHVMPYLEYRYQYALQKGKN